MLYNIFGDKMFKAEFKNSNVYISGIAEMNLAQTLDCGQAFRWEEQNGVWLGVAFGKYLEIEIKDSVIILYNTTEEDFNNIWCDYFDFERDYGKIITEISSNEILKKASEFGKGIPVLNQEPWETLCSFIISQNNNIKRIILSRIGTN